MPWNTGSDVGDGSFDQGIWYGESTRIRPATEIPKDLSSASLREIARESRPPRDQPIGRNQYMSTINRNVEVTPQKNGATDARFLEETDVVPSHLVHATFPQLCCEELRVMDSPNIAM
jgi:hypothetical protein